MKVYITEGDTLNLEVGDKLGINKSAGGSRLKITSVDLVKRKCDLCGEQCYPSVLTTLENRWKYKYVCETCLAKKRIMGKREFRKKVKNMTQNKVVNSFVDNTWKDGPAERDMFESLTGIEEVDKEYIDHIGLRKVHDYLNGLEEGIVAYTKEEMIEYLNFYGNDAEIVITLHILSKNKPNNRFIRETYIDSRTRKLSREQISSLSRQREFKFLRSDNSFWEMVEDLSELLGIIVTNEPNESVIKDYNTVEELIDIGYCTAKQSKMLKKMYKKYNTNLKGEN